MYWTEIYSGTCLPWIKGIIPFRFGVVQYFPQRESLNRRHIFSIFQTKTTRPMVPILVCANVCSQNEIGTP